MAKGGSVGGIGGLGERVWRARRFPESPAEIARPLYITERTTRNHVSKILRKLDLRDRTQPAIFAVERGIVERRNPGKF